MDLQQSVTRLLDIRAIMDLAIRYAISMDERDLDGVVAQFEPHLRVPRSDGSVQHGRDALRASLGRSMAGSSVSVLAVTNHLVTFAADSDPDDTDSATGIVYCRCVGTFGAQTVEQMIRYDDDYVRLDGAWYFRNRLHRLWWGVETAERPLEQEPAGKHGAVGLGTLPYELPSWQRFNDRVS